MKRLPQVAWVILSAKKRPFITTGPRTLVRSFAKHLDEVRPEHAPHRVTRLDRIDDKGK